MIKPTICAVRALLLRSILLTKLGREVTSFRAEMVSRLLREREERSIVRMEFLMARDEESYDL